MVDFDSSFYLNELTVRGKQYLLKSDPSNFKFETKGPNYYSTLEEPNPFTVWQLKKVICNRLTNTVSRPTRFPDCMFRMLSSKNS